MMDVFEKQQHTIDVEMLSALLKAPVIPVNAKTGRGRKELAEKVRQVLDTKPEIPYEFDEAAREAGPHGKIFARYNFISEAVQESVWHSDHKQHLLTEKIDRVLTHKFFGLVILVLILLVVFQTIFSWASLPMDLLEKGFGSLADFVRAEMPPGHTDRSACGRYYRGRGRRCCFSTADIAVVSLYFFARGQWIYVSGRVPAG
jgi:ferrous iron transport protein B